VVVAELSRFGAGYDFAGDAPGFVHGDREPVTPLASYKSADVTFSVFDIESRGAVHEIAGPDPTRPRLFNHARILTVSPDQTVVAAALGGVLDLRPVGIPNFTDGYLTS
jgi:hypothetical protein